MDYLMRDDSHLTKGQWREIDAKVIAAARSVLVGRHVLGLYGPLGAGVRSVELEDATGGKVRPVEVPVLSTDFTLAWRDLQEAERLSVPLSLSKVTAAASSVALQEDKLVFLGNDELGVRGLVGTPGAKTVKIRDWSQGENAFADTSEGLEHMLDAHTYGRTALVVSSDLYVALQRIQPGTGMLESQRVSALLDGGVLRTPVLPKSTAVLLSAGEQNMDLVIGQDLITGFLGSSDLNLDFRVLETVLPRVKNPDAVVVFRA
jgi:uncharacterized linocin/CFP29 family protein